MTDNNNIDPTIIKLKQHEINDWSKFTPADLNNAAKLLKNHFRDSTSYGANEVADGMDNLGKIISMLGSWKNAIECDNDVVIPDLIHESLPDKGTNINFITDAENNAEVIKVELDSKFTP